MDPHDFNKNFENSHKIFLSNLSKRKEKYIEIFSIFDNNQHYFNLLNKKYKTNNDRYYNKLLYFKNSNKDKDKEINMNFSNNYNFENSNNFICNNYHNDFNNDNIDDDKYKDIILKNPSDDLNYSLKNSNNVNFNININNYILQNNNDINLTNGNNNKSISLNEDEDTKNEYEKIKNLLESKNIEHYDTFKQNNHKISFKLKKKECFYEYLIKTDINKKIIWIDKLEKKINKFKTSYRIEDNTIHKGINELINLLKSS